MRLVLKCVQTPVWRCGHTCMEVWSDLYGCVVKPVLRCGHTCTEVWSDLWCTFCHLLRPTHLSQRMKASLHQWMEVLPPMCPQMKPS